MKILLTGAGGYIGPDILGNLENAGVEVRTCDIGWFTGASVRNGPWTTPDVADFTGISTSQLESVNAVIHLAGYSNDPLGHLHPEETDRLNFRATVDLARRARDAGVGAFVFASSCSVYGNSGDAVADEGRRPSPLTPYALSKALAEEALLELQTPNFRVALLRGATAFGASPVPRTDLLLNEFCAEAALGQSAVLTSTGESWRPFMPVSDFSRALCTAALHAPADATRRPVWNIAPPTMQMMVREAANLTAKIAQLPPPRIASGAAQDGRSYRVDGSRFTVDFPTYRYSSDFEAQLRFCMESFGRIETLRDDLRTKRFVRLEALRRLGRAAQ
jgi:nucleoside-diphosphate-sugar epimerase